MATGGAVLLAIVVIAIAHVLRGVSGGLAALFGDRPWLGDLAVGVGTLLLLALTMYVCLAIKVPQSPANSREKHNEL
jgi:phage shock protein PspC (stress-responsive transcriptional regulator)